MSANLRAVSTAALTQLRDAIASGALRTPIDRAALIGFGVRHQLEALIAALSGHKSAACVAILDVVLAEREVRRPSPELVWTGPEAPAGAARDTAIVLRALFENARESVILAGYSFDHARDVLAPLHASMVSRTMDVRFFVDVAQVGRGVDPAAHLTQHLGQFATNNWPFGPPQPRVFYDRRALVPGPPYCSLHAKCVVVDGARAFAPAPTSRSAARSGTSRSAC